MGRATIVGGGEDGLFTIALDYGQGMRDAMVARIDARIALLNVDIAEKGDAIALAEIDTQAAQQGVAVMIDALTAAMQADPKGNHSALIAAVERATRDALLAKAREAGLRVPRDLEIAERASLVRRKGELQAAMVTETRQAWCVDLTESAAGSVATIEVPGEDQAILLAPGARPPGAADGRLLAREVMSPEQVFFNAAVLPGWQKFKPDYRKGTIVAVDKDRDLATVDLDSASSSAQGLGVNQQTRLEMIPVQYMTCHAEVFEPGDRVVVQFVDRFWSASRVIGFVDHPKSCARFTLNYLVQTVAPDGVVFGVSIVFPLPVIAGDTEQQVPLGGDGTEVFAPATGGQYFWLGWTDGNTSNARTDMDVIASATFGARYLAVEGRVACSVSVSFILDDPLNPLCFVGLSWPYIPGYEVTLVDYEKVYQQSSLPTVEQQTFSSPQTMTCTYGGNTYSLTFVLHEVQVNSVTGAVANVYQISL